MHNTQVQELAEAIGKGASLVVVDPRFSVAAGKARYWLPIKPGTDIALLLAWMQRARAGEALRRRVRRRSTRRGFDALAAHVADKTPEWAFAITGHRPRAHPRHPRASSASARPASLIHPGRHTTWYGDDTQRERAMAILAALLGSWGRRGGYLTQAKFPLPGYPLPPDLPHHGGAATVADRPKAGGYPLATEVLASGLCDATPAGPRALRPEGLDRLRLQPHAGDAGAAGADREDAATSTSWSRSTSSPPRSPAGPTSSSPRRPTSSATTTSPPPRTSGRSSRSGRRRSSRCTTRSRAGGSRRSSPTASASASGSRGRTRRSTSGRGSRRRGSPTRSSPRRACCSARPSPPARRRGAPVGAATESGKIAALREGPRRARVRSAAGLPPAG